MSEQKYRAEFEATLPFELQGRFNNGVYAHYETEHQWIGYLAACRAREAECQRLRDDIAGFPNLSAMRQCMVDAADENITLRTENAQLTEQLQLRDEIGSAMKAVKEENARLREALKGPLDAVKATGYTYHEPDWNPDAHVEVTLTVAEVRRIRNAVDDDAAQAALALMASDVWPDGYWVEKCKGQFYVRQMYNSGLPITGPHKEAAEATARASIVAYENKQENPNNV